MRILASIVQPTAGFLLLCIAYDFQGSTVGSKLVRHDDMRVSIAFHGFSEEFQRCFAISALRNKGFQNFTFMIHSTPKIVRLAVDLHENFVQVPLPIGMGALLLDAFSADLGGEQRAEPIPPKADRFVANVDAALVQQVFDISKRKWKSDVHHYRQANDLGRRFEISKWAWFGHGQTLCDRPARLKQFSSDRAV